MNKKNYKFSQINILWLQNIYFIVFFLISFKVLANEKFLNLEDNKIETLRKIQTFSGPMGMGLVKSYEKGDYKFCIYNTINGQETIYKKNLYFECPKEYKKK